jgi:exodeoxyribonuclease-5
MGERLTADQLVADNQIKHWFLYGENQVYVLTGYAGTGKTTLLKHVVCETLELEPDHTAAFVTPTGKAATVLIRSGIDACTLHRLIYQSQTQETEVVVNGKTVKVERLVFRRRESIDKAIRLIVLDEASMVSDEVLADILKFGVKVLLCGDNAQLSPVEGFNSYLKKPDFTLSTIVRQQQDNPIVMLSKRVRENKFIGYGNYGDKVFVINKRQFVGEKRQKLLLRANQVICGTNRTRTALNEEIRSYCGRGTLPEEGDKLICTYNNWEYFIDEDCRFNMVNGIIGSVHDPVFDKANDIGFMQFQPDFLKGNAPSVIPFDTGIFTEGQYHYRTNDYFEKFDENGEAVGAFTLNRFEYGYAISCHKAQGSEFDNVIIFDESYAFKEDRDRWLYTAITRAKNKLILVR